MARWIQRPIVVWPGELTPTWRRKRSPFGNATWASTMTLLDHELSMIKATDVVIQRAYKEADLRLDGEPRAGAIPEHPGVILNFESKYGPLRYATDVFTSWEANVRAIALSLEALRRVDRYGITKAGEQYMGWKRLDDGKLSRAAARQWIQDHGGSIRQALIETHPDHGGSAADLQRTLEARRILEPVIPSGVQP